MRALRRWLRSYDAFVRIVVDRAELAGSEKVMSSSFFLRISRGLVGCEFCMHEARGIGASKMGGVENITANG